MSRVVNVERERCQECGCYLKLVKIEVKTKLVTYTADRWICNNSNCKTNEVLDDE